MDVSLLRSLHVSLSLIRIVTVQNESRQMEEGLHIALDRFRNREVILITTAHVAKRGMFSSSMSEERQVPSDKCHDKSRFNSECHNVYSPILHHILLPLEA